VSAAPAGVRFNGVRTLLSTIRGSARLLLLLRSERHAIRGTCPSGSAFFYMWAGIHDIKLELVE
jgi:hypothetical protein